MIFYTDSYFVPWETAGRSSSGAAEVELSSTGTKAQPNGTTCRTECRLLTEGDVLCCAVAVVGRA